MILAGKGRAREISQVKGLDLIGSYVRVHEGVTDGLDGKRPEITVGEGSKSSFSDAENGNSSHIDSRIAPMFGLACTFGGRGRLTIVESPAGDPQVSWNSCARSQPTERRTKVEKIQPYGLPALNGGKACQ
jgi:hypothetical protein